MRRYRHLVWDWNGTLLDDVAHCLLATNGLLQAHGLPTVDLERYRALFDFPIRAYYEALGFDLQTQSFEQLAVEWFERYSGHAEPLRLHPEARDTLRAVAASGATQSILSALKQHRLDVQVRELRIAAHFNACVGTDNDLGESKVSAGKHWLAQAELDPSATLLLGDTTHDLEVAQALGIDCALIASGHQNHARLAATGHTTVLGGLSEIVAWLAR